jgi:hypothetical protein
MVNDQAPGSVARTAKRRVKNGNLGRITPWKNALVVRALGFKLDAAVIASVCDEMRGDGGADL